MFCVALVEIVTDACATPALISSAVPHRIVKADLRMAHPP
jgi:hypothetical protein